VHNFETAQHIAKKITDIPSMTNVGRRKGIWPVKKLSGGMLAWLSGMRCSIVDFSLLAKRGEAQ